jgi:hypothetical protein
MRATTMQRKKTFWGWRNTKITQNLQNKKNAKYTEDTEDRKEENNDNIQVAKSYIGK